MITLFDELKTIEDRIEISTSALNATDLNELDEKYLELWDEILDFQPDSSQSAEMMLLMLLGKFEELAAQKENCIQVREKIMELFQMVSGNALSSEFSSPMRKPVAGIA